MSRRELMNRREFIATAGAAVAAVACGGDSPNATAAATMGSIRGSVVDMAGTSKGVGRIFLLDKGGLNKGVFTDVTSAGAFDFGDVAVGEYQLQYWGANLAHVPEPLPNPVPIAVRAGVPTVVRFQVDAAEEDELMDRDINAGDFFFQEQPSGEPNAVVTVKLGTLVCWYNVGTMRHTVSGGPWGTSGPMDHGDNFQWRANQVGSFPYRCDFHSSRMLATLKVEP
jgi:plastocyanin